MCMDVEGKEFDELMDYWDSDGDGLISYEVSCRFPALKEQCEEICCRIKDI